MEIKYFREFVTLAETGNFMETANRLYISQSTLSRHLQSMEAEFGVPLFTRTTRRVEINENGKLLLPYAQKIVEMEDGYNEAFANRFKSLPGHLSIGSIPIMAQYNITGIIADFQKAYPDIALDITEAESSRLKNLVLNNKCDFAFVREVSDAEKEFAVLSYTTDWLAAVLPAAHPLAHAGIIRLEQLKDDKFLLLPEGTLVHTLCMRACREAGFEPKICYTGHRASNIVDLISKGMGVAILSKKSTIFYSNPAIAIADIVPRVNTNIDVIYLQEKILSETGKCFLEFLKTHIGSSI